MAARSSSPPRTKLKPFPPKPIKMFKIKRVNAPPEASNERRVLVDRLWPRGISKERARIDEWLKETAPS